MSRELKKLNLCENSNLFKLDYPIRRVISNIKCIRLRIRSIIQRARYGVSMYDSWDFNYYLMVVIENGLKMLKDMGNGYPGWTSYEDWQRKLEYMSKLSELSNLEESYITNKSFDVYLEYIEKYGLESSECEKARDEWLEDEDEKYRLQYNARHKVLKELEKYIEDLWD